MEFVFLSKPKIVMVKKEYNIPLKGKNTTNFTYLVLFGIIILSLLNNKSQVIKKNIYKRVRVSST